MQTITFAEYNSATANDPYYRRTTRWHYFQKVIDIINREEPGSVLELGPRKLPLVHGSDTMDREQFGIHLTYLHDAAEIPWPIKDSTYDMFIALQVWEHLQGKQQQAFKEVMRVSRKAILSFPYKWHRAKRESHRSIDEKKIAEWTLNVSPQEIQFAAGRAVYLFNFCK